MLNIENLSLYKRGSSILEAISFNSCDGAVLSLIGPNGSGKTSLLKVLAGIETPRTGSITYCGEDLLSMPPKQRASSTTFVPKPKIPPFSFTVEEFIAMGAYHKRKGADKNLTEALRKTATQTLKDRFVNELSSGELQRVYIARSLVTEAPIILLDEPTADLDIQHKENVWNILEQLRQEGKILIVATHDFKLIERVADQVLLLSKGKLTTHKNFTGLLATTHLEDTFQVPTETFIQHM